MCGLIIIELLRFLRTIEKPLFANVMCASASAQATISRVPVTYIKPPNQLLTLISMPRSFNDQYRIGWYFLCALLSVAPLFSATAQQVSFVANVGQSGNAGTIGIYKAVFNSELYFTGRTGLDPHFIKRLNSNNTVSVIDETVEAPYDLVAFNNTLCFGGRTSPSGPIHLWEYDGVNPPVAAPLADDYSTPRELTVANGKLYFRASSTGNGSELWVYDGTNAPSMVADLVPGSGSSNPYQMTAFGGKLYWVASSTLWELDGNNAPVQVAAASGLTLTNPSQLGVWNGQLYFGATVVGTERRLCHYDGVNPTDTISGPGPVNINGAGPHGLPAVYNGELYYTAAATGYDSELWKYDGTNPPVLVHDFNAGSSGSTPRGLTEFNGDLFLYANVSGQGQELWRISGSNTPVLEYEFNPGSSWGVLSAPWVLNSKLWLWADDGQTGTELWCTDGVATPVLALDYNQHDYSARPSYLTVYNNKLLFHASEATTYPGGWMYEYNGSGSPVQVAGSNLGSHMLRTSAELNGDLYFSSGGGTSNSELIKYDGVNAPTPVTSDSSGLWPQDVYTMVVFGNKLHMRAALPGTGDEWVEYNGISAPVLKVDMNPGPNHSDTYPFVYNNDLYVSAPSVGTSASQMWKYTGSGSPIHMFPNTTWVRGITNTVELNGTVYGSSRNTSNAGLELHSFDGINPPVLVADLLPGAGNGFTVTSPIEVFNNTIYFEADNNLYSYDGVNPPVLLFPHLEHIGDILAHGGMLYFTAKEGLEGTRLYAYDGATVPLLVADVHPSGDADVSHLVVYQGDVYFSGYHPQYGKELWKLSPCQPHYDTLAVEDCSSYTPPGSATTYTTSGLYTEVVSGAQGGSCDTIRTYDVSIAAPAMPVTNVHVYQLTDTSVVLRWDIMPGISTYKITLVNLDGGPNIVRFKYSNQGQKAITGLTAGTRYSAVIRMRCGSDWVQPSAGLVFKTLAQSCPALTTYAAGPVGAVQAKITWTIPAGVPKVWLQWRQLGAPTWNPTVIRTSPSAQYWITGLTPGNSYEWRIKSACTFQGFGSSWSPIQTFMSANKWDLTHVEHVSEGHAVFPNPSDGELNVFLDAASGSVQTCELFNVMGQLVYRQRFSVPETSGTVTLLLPEAQAGRYVLRMIGEQSVQTVSVVFR